MKFGIYSRVSKKFVFGISEATAKDARKKLMEKIGYYESLRYRWKAMPIKEKPLQKCA